MFETNNNNKKSHNFEDFELVIGNSLNMSALKIGLEVFGFGYESYGDMVLVYLSDGDIKTIFVKDVYNIIKNPTIYYATFMLDSSFSKRYVMIVSDSNVPTYEILVKLRNEFPKVSEVYTSDKWKDINREYKYSILCTVIFDKSRTESNKCFY